MGFGFPARSVSGFFPGLFFGACLHPLDLLGALLVPAGQCLGIRDLHTAGKAPVQAVPPGQLVPLEDALARLAGRSGTVGALGQRVPAVAALFQPDIVRGQGGAGKNGGPAGDLLIAVTVRPHPTFRREGTSVFCEAPITYAQAVLGGTLEIPTIDGKVKYDIPEGTQTGSVFRLRGKGIPALNGRGRGDQYVTVNIETPKNLNKEQKEALKKFSDLLGESNYEKRKSFFGKKR